MAATEPQPQPIAPPKPIIIIKKRGGGHGGHHGGAWKVAYADFVTAMMALFIVLWLMGSDEEIRKAIAGYFRDPAGYGKMAGTGKAATNANSIQLPKDDMAKLQEKLQKAIEALPNFKALKNQVEMSITPDGLRIELLETEAGMFFDLGKPIPNDKGAELLSALAAQLGKLPNHVLVEGHTDSKPYSGDGGYTNWELSADRANAARKIMEANGLYPLQVGQVRGFADRQLRHPENPENPANRRISVIVQYMERPPQSQNAADPEKKAPKK